MHTVNFKITMGSVVAYWINFYFINEANENRKTLTYCPCLNLKSEFYLWICNICKTNVHWTTKSRENNDTVNYFASKLSMCLWHGIAWSKYISHHIYNHDFLGKGWHHNHLMRAVHHIFAGPTLRFLLLWSPEHWHAQHHFFYNICRHKEIQIDIVDMWILA